MPTAIPFCATTAATSRTRRRCAGSATSRRSASTATAGGAWIDETTPTQAALAARPPAHRGRERTGSRSAAACGIARANLPPCRHLRPRPQRHRPAARRHGASHRQAGTGVQPHPCRRHRRSVCAAMLAPPGARHLQRHRRRAGAAAGRCRLCRRAVAHAAAAGGRVRRRTSLRRWPRASMPTTAASAIHASAKILASL